MSNPEGKHYQKEFKVSAVKMVLEQAMSAAKAAKDLGISQSSLSLWVKQFKKNELDSFPGSGRLLPHEKEIHNLKQQLRRVTQEREILKKAITFFRDHQG